MDKQRVIIDDGLLTKRIRQSDEKALKELFDRFFVPLCRFVDLYSNNHQVSEEIVMDVFMNIWERRTSFYIKLSLKAYLFSAARNKALNYIRDRRPMVSLDELQADPAVNAELSLENEELILLIVEAVGTLPERCKTVFQLSRKENLSHNEIAENLNISVKTVEGQITKALKIIRQKLGPDYHYFF